jgi:hypothetical protein
MPSKYIREDEALIGVGATLLQHIDKKINLSSLWDNVKHIESIGTFERFILTLDLLFLLGLIDVRKNEIVRITP